MVTEGLTEGLTRGLTGERAAVPLGEVLEAQPELVVVSVELGVAGDLRQEHLRHFQRPLSTNITNNQGFIQQTL